MGSTERSKSLRQRRQARGLKRISFWVTEADLALAKQVAQSFERVALASEAELRQKLKEQSLEQSLDAWKSWLSQNPEKVKKVYSTEIQRLRAFQLARALEIELPDETTLSDYQLLNRWLKDTRGKK